MVTPAGNLSREVVLERTRETDLDRLLTSEVCVEAFLEQWARDVNRVATGVSVFCVTTLSVVSIAGMALIKWWWPL